MPGRATFARLLLGRPGGPYCPIFLCTLRSAPREGGAAGGTDQLEVLRLCSYPHERRKPALLPVRHPDGGLRKPSRLVGIPQRSTPPRDSRGRYIARLRPARVAADTSRIETVERWAFRAARAHA